MLRHFFCIAIAMFIFCLSSMCQVIPPATNVVPVRIAPKPRAAAAKPQNSYPKLIIGLVVDQMRWDFLYRFNNLYSADGFRRLMKEGYSCENTMIPYVPTYTAPGHTCIYTGSVPAIHGIVGNNWYNSSAKKKVYCTDDDTAQTVGSSTKAGKMSPANLWATTITDELRLSNNFQSKVIGIGLKDRGAILPAGHTANAAYWYDDKVGKWITSNYYSNKLPTWVNDFNDKDWPSFYMAKDWTTLLSTDKYGQSSPDYADYEDTIKGEGSVIFPHKLSQIKTDKLEAFKTTPFASTYTFDFAKVAIENEELGKNSVPDFLTVSISSTDYIGHTFGPNSVETEDAYLRLDKDIVSFLQYLDRKFGKGNYLFFLTADHGVAHVPGFMKQHKIPAGALDDKDIEEAMNKAVEQKFQINKGIAKVMNYQIYLSDAAKEKGEEIKKFIIQELKKENAVSTAFDLEELAETTLAQPLKERIANGYASSRSGDIQFVFKPGYFDGRPKGTTHGLWNPYDAHIPLLFFGWKVKSGKLLRETYMTDIAPTLAAMLQIQMPSGCVGHVIPEVIK